MTDIIVLNRSHSIPIQISIPCYNFSQSPSSSPSQSPYEQLNKNLPLPFPNQDVVLSSNEDLEKLSDEVLKYIMLKYTEDEFNHYKKWQTNFDFLINTIMKLKREYLIEDIKKCKINIHNKLVSYMIYKNGERNSEYMFCRHELPV